MNHLRSYITLRCIKQSDFAAVLGITQSMVSRLITGATTPSLDLAVRIERVTDGAVPASAWIPLPSAETPTPNQEDAA